MDCDADAPHHPPFGIDTLRWPVAWLFVPPVEWGEALTLSMAQLAAVLVLGISSFLSGWMLRRILAKSREAQLQKFLAAANTAIPSLETNVRNRDHRIASLFSELTEWKAKAPTLEATAKRYEVEILAKEKELRAARVEIDALKLTVAAAPDPAKLRELETVRNSLRDAQARCSELTAAIAERDARFASAVAPSFIALPVAPATESEAVLHTRVEFLESSLAVRDAQIADLQSRLDSETETVRGIRAELDSRAAEIERAQAEGAKWQARVPKLLATIKARETTLAERETTIAERDATLAARNADVAERDAMLAAANADVAERDATLAAQDAIVAERDAMLAARDADIAERDAMLAARDAAVSERDAMLATREAELADRVTALQHGEARIADLSAQLATMSQQLEAAAAHHAAILANAARLGREELDSQHATLERVQAEHDAQLNRSHALEGEVAALQIELREATQTAADDARRHATAEAELRARSAEIAQAVARAQQQLADQQSAQEQQRVVAAEQRAQLEWQLAQANEHRAQVERRLADEAKRAVATDKRFAGAMDQVAHLEQRLTAERQRGDDAAANAALLDRARTELESRLVAAGDSRAALERQVAALQSECDATEHRVRQAQREANERVAQDTEEQTIELVELRDEVRTLHARVAPLESLLKQRDSALFERAERIESMTSQIQALVAQTESLQVALRQRGEKIATLERKFSNQPPPAATSESTDRRGDDLEQRLVAQIERNRELSKIVEERDRDLAAAAKSNELNGKSMLVLKQQLDDARQAEARLAAQLHEVTAASQRAPEADATPARAQMSKPNGLFDRPPERVDELQQIRGIGDGFERGLNKLGIYQFSQLAGLSVSEIVWIEAHLPTFHGRIDRDDWPGQAAALMAASEHAQWSLRARSAPSMSSRIN